MFLLRWPTNCLFKPFVQTVRVSFKHLIMNAEAGWFGPPLWPPCAPANPRIIFCKLPSMLEPLAMAKPSFVRAWQLGGTWFKFEVGEPKEQPMFQIQVDKNCTYIRGLVLNFVYLGVDRDLAIQPWIAWFPLRWSFLNASVFSFSCLRFSFSASCFFSLSAFASSFCSLFLFCASVSVGSSADSDFELDFDFDAFLCFLFLSPLAFLTFLPLSLFFFASHMQQCNNGCRGLPSQVDRWIVFFEKSSRVWSVRCQSFKVPADMIRHDAPHHLTTRSWKSCLHFLNLPSLRSKWTLMPSSFSSCLWPFQLLPCSSSST